MNELWIMKLWMNIKNICLFTMALKLIVKRGHYFSCTGLIKCIKIQYDEDLL